MKVATYRQGGKTLIGIVEADKGRLFDLAGAARRDGVTDRPFASMLDLIDADDPASIRRDRSWRNAAGGRPLD